MTEVSEKKHCCVTQLTKRMYSITFSLVTFKVKKKKEEKQHCNIQFASYVVATSTGYWYTLSQGYKIS